MHTLSHKFASMHIFIFEVIFAPSNLNLTKIFGRLSREKQVPQCYEVLVAIKQFENRADKY